MAMSGDAPAPAPYLDLLRREGVNDPRLLAAVAGVDRAKFVPPELVDRAWDDCPLPIGHDQTISQPSLVAWMTARLDPQPRDRVLEIGTGCGYQTAILA
jgi:protein-L-isoaspartate(D-aspartate) O-methyltransferase